MTNRFSALQTQPFDDLFDTESAPAPARELRPEDAASTAAPAKAVAGTEHDIPGERPASGSRERILEAKVILHRRMLEEFNLVALEKLPRDQLVGEIRKFVTDYVNKERLALNNAELEEFVGTLVDEMTGLGPLEPLMRNPEISDILINGHKNCYAEIKGVLQPVVIPFKDEAHLLRVVNKIVAAVGRRIDESNPMCDARMADGSRFNAAIRPIAIDGPLHGHSVRPVATAQSIPQ